MLSLADFLGSMITFAVARPGGLAYFRVSARGVDLPAPLSAYTLKRPIPSGRGSVTAASPRRHVRKKRNVDRLSIDSAVRLRLRSRLTPGRLTLPGKP